MNTTNKICINGKEYDVSYLGEEDITAWEYEDFIKRQTWRIEGSAYEDIKNHKNTLMTGIIHGVRKFPKEYSIKAGQAFIIEYVKKDGSANRLYHLANGEFGDANGNIVSSDTEGAIEFTRQYRGISERTDKMTVGGKEYDATYFGELDMTSWTEDFKCREFWRLEDAYDDFKDNQTVGGNIIPYNNFPMNIELGQVFVIQYNKKDGTSYKQYLRSDGYIWNTDGKELPSNTEFYAEPPKPERIEKMTVGGKEYEASYFKWRNSGIWRLESAYDDFKDKQQTGDVLPYNNYSFPVEEGQVFALEWPQEDGTMEYGYYVSNGAVWKGMPSTVQVNLEAKLPEKIEKWAVNGKEYEAYSLKKAELAHIPDWDSGTQLSTEIYDSVEIWRLENAYDDLKSTAKTGDAVPHDCLPIYVEEEQVYVMDYTKKDGVVERKYYITDGTIQNDELSAAEILVE